MLLNDKFLLNLPFPYFLISKSNMLIEKRSLLSSTSFPTVSCLKDLIKHDHDTTLYTISNGSSIPLLLKSGHYVYHQIYLYSENDQYDHVFAIPKESVQIEDINNLVATIETKFNDFHKELSKNKDYIRQSLSEIQEAMVSKQHNQNLERLAVGIAHEIRNPLTTVSAFIQLIKPYLNDIGKGQYAEIAIEELNRANEMIIEFLNEAKPHEHSQRPVSINKLVAETTLLYECEAKLKNTKIYNHLTDVKPLVLANPHQLKQVIVNLLKNAIEAIVDNENSRAHGIIHLHTVVNNQVASIVIDDNGCGMEAKTLENLYKPFQTTKAYGTGIGLNVCKNIIEQHKGTIEVTSKCGEGTRFQINFPLHRPQHDSGNCQKTSV